MLEKLKSLKALMSPLTAFFAGTMLTSAAYSLLSSYLAIRLNSAKVPTSYVGIVLSVYYLGYIFATLSAHKIINRVGHIRAFSSYISLLSALILLHIIWFNPLYWGILRLIEGYCMASAFICLESWLNTRSNNQNRGMVMSLYMVTTYIGAAFGQLMLNVPDNQNVVTLILISVLFSVALIPVSLTALPSPDISKHKQMSIKQLYKIAPVGVIGCIISGVLVGNIYTLGAIYAEAAGLSLYHISLFMFFCIFGGMSAQIPIGRLSDIMDRRFIMMWCGSCLFFIAPWIHMFIDGSIIELAGAALLLGAGSFILYPICVSHVNDKIDDEERVEASGLLIMLQSFGMIIGPIVVSYLMQIFGAISFLISFSVSNGFFVLFAFKHISFKPDVNYINITKTDPMPLNPTHIYPEIAKSDSLLDRAANLFMHKNKNEE
ncbi:MAG: MFS transporter [Alphaproteobacteria bacterium]|nr:MFS transporter [Alphaproteobacteria bacterium]